MPLLFFYYNYHKKAIGAIKIREFFILYLKAKLNL